MHEFGIRGLWYLDACLPSVAVNCPRATCLFQVDHHAVQASVSCSTRLSARLHTVDQVLVEIVGFEMSKS